MPLAGAVAALLLVLGASPSCHGARSHNITDILAKRSDFTEFSAALSITGAAAEIDGHPTITVLAVNNTVMAQLRALQLQPSDLQRVIYLQVLFDYFDAAKLRSIQESTIHVTSLYQASGKAPESAGMETVTVLRDGRVTFSLSDRPANAPPPAASFYQRSIQETPYDIAVLQVSALIGSPALVAAPPPPTVPLAPAPASSPAHAAAAPAPAPVSSPPAPASSPGHAAAAPAPAPVSSPPHAPAAPAPAPVVAPATPPTPRRRPAPSPEDTPAPAPDADSEPPADQKNNGARDTTPWSLGAAAVAAAIVLLLW